MNPNERKSISIFMIVLSFSPEYQLLFTNLFQQATAFKKQQQQQQQDIKFNP